MNTFQDALSFFEHQVAQTNDSTKIKLYKDFIQLIQCLEEKSASASSMQSILGELNHLSITPASSEKEIRKALKRFKTYLKTSFSFTSKGYYTQRYITIGFSLGAIFGIVLFSNSEGSLHITFGMLCGLTFGWIVGRNKEAKAKTAGTLL